MAIFLQKYVAFSFPEMFFHIRDARKLPTISPLVSRQCKASSMNRVQLYRKFQALTDQPVGHYFRSLRLHKAQALLRNTELHVSEIAFEVGFKDPAHFTRAFSEEFGVSPREWRKGL